MNTAKTREGVVVSDKMTKTRVVMIERNPDAFKSLQANAAALQARAVELRRADALEFVRADDGVVQTIDSSFVGPAERQ